MSAPKYIISPNVAPGKHDQSPSWVVVFWCCDEPRTGFNENKLKIRERIIIINDAVSVNVGSNKADHIKTASVNLKITDAQYDERVRPNDYMAVWMCRWESDADEIVNKLINGKGTDLNSFMSGLKFFGKVKSVSKSVNVADDGAPEEIINVQGNMFTELNMSAYMSRLYETFNQGAGSANISNQGIANLGFLRYLDPQIYEAFLNQGDSVFKTPDQVISFFTKIFLGNGVNAPDIRKEFSGTPDNIGNKIVLPQQVFQDVLGHSASKRYIDNIYFYTGVEKYTPGDANTNPGLLTPNTDRFGPFRQSPNLKGGIILTSSPLENIELYSLYEKYLNDACNELYTTMRYSPDGGIRPAVIARQIPFSTPQLDLIINAPNGRTGGQKIQRPAGTAGLITEFKSLPRWKVDKTLIKSVNVGMGSASHINMVHIYTTPFWTSLGGLNSEQTTQAQKLIQASQYAMGSIVYDEADIQKNGLRAFIKESNFESIEFSNKSNSIGAITSPFWSAMQGDFLFNMHLKLSGRVSCYGLQEPICVGDNFELDGIVYHIEGVDHMCQVFPTGNKKFMSILTLSNGVWDQALDNTKSFLASYPTISIPHTFEIYGLTQQQEGPQKAANRLKASGG